MNQLLLTSSLLAALCLQLPSAHGADADGRFAIKGYGRMTCATFIEERTAKTPDYLRFGGWLNGYLTASNRYEPNTFDLASWQGSAIMTAWLASWCQARPGEPFVTAVARLVNRLGGDRLQVESELVAIEDDEATLPSLYKATLERAQRGLIALGHLAGEPSGVLDEATRKALGVFQHEAGLLETSLPDQQTLAALLQSGSVREP